jgi:hypothetical protein
MSSFHIDERVSLKLEYDFAVCLGEFILESGTEDKKILALGHRLNNLEGNEEISQPVRFSSIVNKSYNKNYKKEYQNWDQEEDPNFKKTSSKIQIRRRSTAR